MARRKKTLKQKAMDSLKDLERSMKKLYPKQHIGSETFKYQYSLEPMMVQTYVRHQQSTLDYPLLYPIVDAPRTKWTMTVDGEHRIHYWRVYRPDVTGKVVSSLIEGEWNWAIYQDSIFDDPESGGAFDRLADGVASDAYTAMAQVDEAYANLIELGVL